MRAIIEAILRDASQWSVHMDMVMDMARGPWSVERGGGGCAFWPRRATTGRPRGAPLSPERTAQWDHGLRHNDVTTCSTSACQSCGGQSRPPADGAGEYMEISGPREPSGRVLTFSRRSGAPCRRRCACSVVHVDVWSETKQDACETTCRLTAATMACVTAARLSRGGWRAVPGTND